MDIHEDRDRAESFGSVAADYDAYRPSYPAELIAAVMTAASATAATGALTSPRPPRILDAGAGTGILATQLVAAGAEVLAVEPDPEMAAVAQAKGLEVEVAGFEDWNPRGRCFDLVSFGQSFHWVDSDLALPRIREVLVPGGQAALAWNDVEAIGELGERLTAIASSFHPTGMMTCLGSGEDDGRKESSAGVSAQAPVASARSVNVAAVEHPALFDLRKHGFDSAEQSFTEDLHYSKEHWLSMIFTYSAQLTMESARREAMRRTMASAIPVEGVEARNDALLILARPAPPQTPH